MADDIDKALAEIDQLAIADAVGVLRGGPREPSGEWLAEMARRQRAAKGRAQDIDRRRRIARQFHDPYPDASQPSEEQLRDLANELVRDHGFDPAYLAARYGLTRRSR